MSDTGRFHGCCPDPTCPEHFPMSIPSSPILDFEKARSSASIGPHGEIHPDIEEHILEAQAQAAVSPLLAEIEKLREMLSSAERGGAAAVRKMDAAEAEAQKLREALTKYGQCLSTCATQGQYYPARFNMNYCDCGLRKALGGS